MDFKHTKEATLWLQWEIWKTSKYCMDKINLSLKHLAAKAVGDSDSYTWDVYIGVLLWKAILATFTICI